MTNILKPNYTEGDGFYQFETLEGAKVVMPSSLVIFVDDDADEEYIAIKSTVTRSTLYLLQRV